MGYNTEFDGESPHGRVTLPRDRNRFPDRFMVQLPEDEFQRGSPPARAPRQLSRRRNKSGKTGLTCFAILQPTNDDVVRKGFVGYDDLRTVVYAALAGVPLPRGEGRNLLRPSARVAPVGNAVAQQRDPPGERGAGGLYRNRYKI